MIPKIKMVEPMPDFKLKVLFDDGKTVIYNVKEDIETIESYKDLAAVHGLFQQVQLDESRTCVYWNDQIDLLLAAEILATETAAIRTNFAAESASQILAK